MKGNLTIEVDGARVSCHGNLTFRNELEPYLVLHAAAKCLGITTVEQFARLAVVSTLQKPSKSEVFEQTKIVLPRNPEKG